MDVHCFDVVVGCLVSFSLSLLLSSFGLDSDGVLHFSVLVGGVCFLYVAADALLGACCSYHVGY